MDNGRTVKIVQETRYPWDGEVKMTVNPDKNADRSRSTCAFPAGRAMRPCRATSTASLITSNEPVALKVNGKPVPFKLEKGYATLNRNWKPGDVIELTLPMPIRRIVANDSVEADRGRVALQRGPLVYCAEWPDNPRRSCPQPDAAGRGEADSRVQARPAGRRHGHQGQSLRSGF